MQPRLNAPDRLMDENGRLRDWLALIRAPDLGATRIRSLLDKFGNPRSIRSAEAGALARHGLGSASIDALQQPDERRIDADLAWLDEAGASMLAWDDEDYPPQLRAIDRPPPVLFVLGDPAVLWLPQLAIVGSRNATRGGLENARAFSRSLTRAGLVVTSGLALGVDGMAHRAALDAGGYTVAVAATGLDRVYPARHRELAREIVARGAIVSEFPPGVEPRAGHFPARNRIIAGLSVGTLVVEAGVTSGSLITARLAMEQNRDVFAIPGSIHNPLAKGCHRLIKDGAKLVETGEDLLGELDVAVRRQIDVGRSRLEMAADEAAEPVSQVRDPEYAKLLDAMGFDPVTLDQLVESTGLTVEAVSSMLLILELDGMVESGPGGRYCRIGEVG